MSTFFCVSVCAATSVVGQYVPKIPEGWTQPPLPAEPVADEATRPARRIVGILEETLDGLVTEAAS